MLPFMAIKDFMSSMLPFIALFGMLYFASCQAQKKIDKKPYESYKLQDGEKEAFFADACYWCTEGIWESIEGVIEVESGFVGGTSPATPTYSNHGDFAEGNRVVYNPNKVSYQQLADAYFDGHSHGMSPDRGQSYRAIAFSNSPEQALIITQRYIQELETYGEFEQELKPIREANWFIGPKDHQDYIKRLEAGKSVPNKRYGVNESIPRRDRALKSISAPKKRKLDREEHYIMVRGGTEPRFSSPLNKEKRNGVYISPATGDVLFHSNDKFDSGTGWPSFDSATSNVALGPAEQGGYEVIEKSTGYHLGHLFTGEGFTDKQKRYCINGDALEFIPTKE